MSGEHRGLVAPAAAAADWTEEATDRVSAWTPPLELRPAGYKAQRSPMGQRSVHSKGAKSTGQLRQPRQIRVESEKIMQLKSVFAWTRSSVWLQLTSPPQRSACFR